MAPGPDSRQSSILKALADETRIRLVRLLAREELSVQEICEILNMPQPKISRHLSVLRGVALVSDHREGSRVYYSLADLDGELGLLRDYIDGIAQQEHPDFQALGACLRKRAMHSRDFAARRASEWDAIGLQLHNTTAALLAVANMAPRGLTVADLGTGTGLLLPILSSFAERVYAVDQSEEMLQHARQRCREHDLENVEFIRGDLELLDRDLPADCDCILLHFVLHQLASPANIMRVAASRLKPGGRLVVVDRMSHEDETARNRFGSLWLGFEEAKIRQWGEAAGLQDLHYQVMRSVDPQQDGIPVFIAAGTHS